MAAPDTRLTAASLRAVRSQLKRANAAMARLHPGERPERQPAHVVYGGAHLFSADTVRKVAKLALAALETYAPDASTLATALDLDERLARRIHSRVVEKLRHEAVEDYRIDFEDGYGPRPDAEEDGHAQAAAKALAEAKAAGKLPASVGIRVKAFSKEGFERAVRTLDVFLGAYVAAAGAPELPEGFVVTLPKVTSREQVQGLAQVLGLLERRLGITEKIAIELMVETPEALVGPRGELALGTLVRAAGARCRGAHFGTYDFTASLGVAAAYQGMDHPSAGLGRRLMQLSLAGSGVWISDGATTAMPVGPHKKGPGGGPLSAAQEEENRDVVYRAWRTSYRNIRGSLREGIYQGWDLHPAQIPVRFVAVHAFFLEALEDATTRLAAFVSQAAQATRSGAIFDDAATGQGLLNFFLRGMACGAISEEEAARTGLTREELATRSFQAILNRRRAAKA
jgi:citrate lyase beta subunit